MIDNIPLLPRIYNRRWCSSEPKPIRPLIKSFGACGQFVPRNCKRAITPAVTALVPRVPTRAHGKMRSLLRTLKPFHPRCSSTSWCWCCSSTFSLAPKLAWFDVLAFFTFVALLLLTVRETGGMVRESDLVCCTIVVFRNFSTIQCIVRDV